MGPRWAAVSVKSAADWQQLLNGQRDSARCDYLEDSARLRLRAVSPRLRELLQSPDVRECPPLLKATAEPLGLSKCAFAELENGQVDGTIKVPRPLFYSLLDEITTWLDVLEDQRQIKRFTKVAADLLDVTASELFLVRNPSVASLLKLIAFTRDEVSRRQRLTALTTVPGVSLETDLWDHFGLQGHPAFIRIAAESTLAALWTAASVVADETLSQPEGDILIAAAWLHDLSLLISPVEDDSRAVRDRHHMASRITQRARLEQSHAALTSALVAGFADFPAELALIIGEHHERADGSGKPRRLKCRQMSPLSLRFATLVRWVALIDRATNREELFPGEVVSILRPTRQLLIEARQGAWDLPICERLLTTLNLPLDEIAKLIAMEAETERIGRIDPLEAVKAGPHRFRKLPGLGGDADHSLGDRFTSIEPKSNTTPNRPHFPQSPFPLETRSVAEEAAEIDRSLARRPSIARPHLLDLRSDQGLPASAAARQRSGEAP